MNKIELTDAVAERAGITKKAAGEAIEALFAVVADTVAAGDVVRISGFGVFEGVERPPRKGVNHMTGQPWSVPATRVPKFKPGTAFKEAVKPRSVAA